MLKVLKILKVLSKINIISNLSIGWMENYIVELKKHPYNILYVQAL